MKTVLLCWFLSTVIASATRIEVRYGYDPSAGPQNEGSALDDDLNGHVGGTGDGTVDALSLANWEGNTIQVFTNMALHGIVIELPDGTDYSLNPRRGNGYSNPNFAFGPNSGNCIFWLHSGTFTVIPQTKEQVFYDRMSVPDVTDIQVLAAGGIFGLTVVFGKFVVRRVRASTSPSGD